MAELSKGVRDLYDVLVDHFDCNQTGHGDRELEDVLDAAFLEHTTGLVKTLEAGIETLGTQMIENRERIAELEAQNAKLTQENAALYADRGAQAERIEGLLIETQELRDASRKGNQT
jgi:hypothetical protein